jgi:hypothetical protein
MSRVGELATSQLNPFQVDVELYNNSSRSLIESFLIDSKLKMLCNDNPTKTPSPAV